MDMIFIRGMRMDAQVGIYRRERTTVQPVEIDLEIGLASARAFETGKVADTIDYAKVTERITHELASKRFGLVEEMAQAIVDIVLNEFGAARVRVSIAKLGILRNVAKVGVTIERSNDGATSRPSARREPAAQSASEPDITSRNWQSSESPSGSNPFADSNTSPL
jgi:dihydroneopterin aldolase